MSSSQRKAARHEGHHYLPEIRDDAASPNERSSGGRSETPKIAIGRVSILHRGRENGLIAQTETPAESRLKMNTYLRHNPRILKL